MLNRKLYIATRKGYDSKLTQYDISGANPLYISLGLYDWDIGPTFSIGGTINEMVELFEEITNELKKKQLSFINEKMGIKTI